MYFRTRRGSSLVFLGGDMCAAYLLEAHHCWTPHRPGGVVELSPVRRLVVERSVGRGGAGIRVVHLERGDNRPDEPVRTLVILEAWRYVAGYTHSEELLAYLGEGDRFTPIGRLAVITNTAMQAPGTLRGVTREGRYAVGLDGLEVEQVLWGREGRRYERPTCSEPPRGLGPGRYRRVRWRFDGRRMVEQVLRERRATPAEERWLADDCVG